MTLLLLWSKPNLVAEAYLERLWLFSHGYCNWPNCLVEGCVVWWQCIISQQQEYENLNREGCKLMRTPRNSQIHCYHRETATKEMFFGEAVPPYAILSHRWNEEEVSFQDLQDGTSRAMPGFTKIQRCCAQAQLDGWQYAWIDSCCIDKTSSAELSEAINSMYRWYKNSQVCYAYLGDVRFGDDLYDELRKSNWFTRGWTLQELLAPATLVFFDQDWSDIGTKGSLEEVISEITGIDDFINFEDACVAQKMSWAATRRTTRLEDMAYCLLGLFNVNMPPLYGEGEKAFRRLQLEILRTSDDESIFAWADGGEIADNAISGPLASSPAQFKLSGCIRPMKKKDQGEILQRDNQPYSMTNKGLYVYLLLIRTTESVSWAGPNQNKFIVPLRCSFADADGGANNIPAIFLTQYLVDGTETYLKASMDSIGEIQVAKIRASRKNSESKHIYITEMVRGDEGHATPLQGWFFDFTAPSLYDNGFSVSQFHPLNLGCTWDNPTHCELSLFIKTISGTVSGVKFTSNNSTESIVLIIIAENHRPPWLLLMILEPYEPLEDIIESLYELYIGASLLRIRKEGARATIGGYSDMSTSNKISSRRTGRKRLPDTNKMRPPLDRISRRLQGGKSVSASLKPVPAPAPAKHDDSPRFLIDVRIESIGGLRWPTPAWADILLMSIGLTDLNLTEDNIPGRRKAERPRRSPSKGPRPYRKSVASNDRSSLEERTNRGRQSELDSSFKPRELSGQERRRRRGSKRRQRSEQIYREDIHYRGSESRDYHQRRMTQDGGDEGLGPHDITPVAPRARERETEWQWREHPRWSSQESGNRWRERW